MSSSILLEEWRDFAACKGVQTSDFFPVKIIKSNTNSIVKILGLCESCPVSSHCLKEAFETDSHGIWGRTTHQQRIAYLESRSSSSKITLDECAAYIEFLSETHHIPYTRQQSV